VLARAKRSISMSDNWMIVLAVDPLATTPSDRAQAAVDLLRQLRLEAQDPELHTSDTPQFFDCGGNFESVFCPFCGLDIGDWWSTAMDRWWNGDDSRLLWVEMPCCNRPTSLNDLDYVMPQGFACIAIELMNVGADLEPEERERVEAALGLPVRIIWRHI
jgi:hypothetical protein